MAAKSCKGLSDKTTSSQPKSAAKNKPKTKEAPKAAATTNGPKPARGAKKSGRAGRPKAKTAEELDAEMQDYFGGETNGTAAPPAQTAAADANMDVIS